MATFCNVFNYIWLHFLALYLLFAWYLILFFCFVFLRDYDWAGAMMNGCINKAGAIQGHAGRLKDLCFFVSFFEYFKV